MVDKTDKNIPGEHRGPLAARTGEDLLVLTIQIYDELGHQREAVSHWGCSVNIECNMRQHLLKFNSVLGVHSGSLVARTGEDLLVLTIQIYDELGHQREAVSHWGCSVNIECNMRQHLLCKSLL